MPLILSACSILNIPSTHQSYKALTPNVWYWEVGPFEDVIKIRCEVMGVGPCPLGLCSYKKRHQSICTFPHWEKKRGKERKQGREGGRARARVRKQEEKEPKKNQRKKITWGHSKKIDTCKPGIVPTRNLTGQNLDLGLLSLHRTVRNKFLFISPTNLAYLIIAVYYQ